MKEEKKKIHLRFSMYGSPNKHPQKVMESIGIIYQHATPQPIGDQWWFWNCENIPNPLPEYLTILDIDPLDAIGFGLDKQSAEEIVGWKSKHGE